MPKAGSGTEMPEFGCHLRPSTSANFFRPEITLYLSPFQPELISGPVSAELELPSSVIQAEAGCAGWAHLPFPGERLRSVEAAAALLSAVSGKTLWFSAGLRLAPLPCRFRTRPSHERRSKRGTASFAAALHPFKRSTAGRLFLNGQLILCARSGGVLVCVRVVWVCAGRPLRPLFA